MGYRSLREEAFAANMEIPKNRLAVYTWGNVSAFDSSRAVFAIKPSGVAYDELSEDAMVVVDLEGTIVEGKLKPSSDTETHRVLYRNFTGIGGVTHTHSPYASAWAQACKAVPVFGTTHADYGAEEIPCTAYLSEAAMKHNYEKETGNLIVETFDRQKKNPLHMTMVLVAGHGPFTWGESAARSVHCAVVLEEICKMGQLTLSLKSDAALPDYLIRKHWERKHGPNAYYGQ
ncbi:MAG: L-ribulose-5-phosphate 4-epimerase AraD [Treponema sp.]|jgi:L-ribulose-5-phosphate 4-epimerase|nr:L-ribulose-5-phosphate 4-epimerase AraD [Treponema sp.]